MNYFFSDLKKICKNNFIPILFVFLLAVMILDPISVYIKGVQNPELFDQIGKNPFRFWLLMNSFGWGGSIYNTLFWIFPVLATGLIFYDERNSSMFTLLIIRDRKIKYMLAKVASAFVFSFGFFLLILSVNLLITYTIFPPMDAKLTEHYNFLIPKKGTFVYGIYQISPLLMAITYTILNAVVIAILSVFTLGIHMIFNLKNKYIAIVVPIIVLYVITFVFDSTADLFQYNIRMIVQPQATIALTDAITGNNVAVTLAIWVLLDIILVTIGFVRNRDVL